MNSMRANWSLMVLGVFISTVLSAQLTIDNAINANAAVQNVLLGSGVTASNITFQGDNAQIGGFTCNGCGLGISNGVVIGTGNVNGATGPNDTGSFNQGPPNSSDGVGDTDLESLSGMSLNNTAALEFDFVPTGDSLAFNYVFSSEEYPEFVNSINDAFGFFLSGPGINGSYSNSAMNVALIPGTSTPISINTVNVGENSSFYVDNGSNSANVQADAFTTVLTAYAQVICGESYHIKIVIGDAMDYMYDSWVFLEAGSFQSNVLSLNYTAPNYSSPVDGGVYEGCQAGNLVFTRSGGLDSELAYALTFGGNAIIGTDIDFPYTEILFPAGESEVSLSFQAIQDFTLEGIESLEITMENSGCGSGSATVTIQVYDLPALQVSVDDALINCGDIVTFEPVITGGLGDYTVIWNGTTEGLSYTVAPEAAATYSYTVSDTCGVIPVSGQVSVSFIQNPPLQVEASDNLTATCLDVQDFQPQISGGLAPYDVAWYVDGAIQSVNTNLLFSSGTSVQMEFVVTDLCGVESSDVFQYNVPAVPITIDLGDDVEVRCIDEVAYNPEPQGGVGAYAYDWLIDNVSQTNAQSFNHYFNADAVLHLEVTDECGNEVTEEVIVSVPPVPVSVTLPDDVNTTCLVTTTLEPTVSGGAGNLSYAWSANGVPFSTATTESYITGVDALISLRVEDECGNIGVDEMNIFIPPVPIEMHVPADTTICLNDGLFLTGSAQGGVGDLILSWNGGSDQAQVYVTPSEPTAYRLYVEDECGNFSAAEVFVNIDNVNPNFTSVYIDDDVVGLTNLLPDSVFSYWEFSDGSFSWEHDTEHRFNTIGDWVATLHAFSAVGCHNEISQTFQATGALFVPNAFSPNGDGINEVWKPVGRDIVSYHVRIFNRNGEMIFESRDMEVVWTGSDRGGGYYVPNGVYSFILQAEDARFNAIERSGFVEVIR
jgi:gliding motility-associated-like protein